MKLFIILIINLTAISTSGAQSLQGKRIITSTISLFGFDFSKSDRTSSNNGTQTSRNRSFNLTPEITYGKVNSKNMLLSYGLGLQIRNSKQIFPVGESIKIKTIGISPTLIAEKLIPLTEKFYYSPLAKLQVGYARSKQNNLLGSSSLFSTDLSFYPLALTCALNPKTNLIFLAAPILLNYYKGVYSFESDTVYEKGVTQAFTFSGTINTIGFGIQKIF